MSAQSHTSTSPRSSVDEYWSDWTVRSQPFASAQESADFLRWRAGAYPLFAEYMDVPGRHSGEVVLDYGCGPGHDTVDFLISSEARKVIGVDLSAKALGLARQRIHLHGVDPERFDLLQTSDATVRIPLEDGSVDYIHCLGVIHHASHPGLVLRELARVLKPGGKGSIMVYNRQSIFFHLWIAYQRQLIGGEFSGMEVEEAFALATDGEKCPISRAYRPEDFVELCLAAGFDAKFAGGYFGGMELDLMRSTAAAAIADERLGVEHRNFLRELVEDESGLFLYRGLTAGHGGVYSIRKPA